jgi:hypothetical protein
MSDMVDKQHRFSLMLARLITYTASLPGYQVTGGDWYRDSRCDYGHPRSLHKLRLAVDLNIFVDGLWRKDVESYRPLGEYWELMGGAWGGRFEEGDANHFSLEHDGMK